MQAIDVVMLTKNSEHILDRCLSSLYQNVPVKNLIVVDGFSTDRTIEILDKLNNDRGNVTIIQTNGSRARAREEGIGRVKTDWFMFVDSDVILSRDWFRNAERNIGNDVGAVWGTNIDAIPNIQDKRFLRIQGLIARQCFNLRGGTHDTLVRRESLAGIQIPEELHTYEDAFIMNWIRKKGYRTVVGENIYCLHYKSPRHWVLKNSVDQAILELKCGLIYSRNFAYMIYYPVFMFNWFMQLSFQGSRRLRSR